MNSPVDQPSPGDEAAAAADARRRVEDVGAILDTLRGIVREIRLAGQEAERRAGLHPAQLGALRHLADSPASSLTELAERTHVDISTVSVLVSRLVEQGLVRRETAPGDGRQRALTLTARGRALARRAPEPGAATVVRAASKLSDREVHRLAAGLSKLAAGLRDVGD